LTAAVPGLLLTPGMFESFIVGGAFASLVFLTPAGSTVTNHSSFAEARAARIAACDGPAPSLPQSIVLAEGLEAIIESALQRSPRFRQQCRALAASTGLAVTVSLAFRPSINATRAQTSFRVTSRSVLARVEIHQPTALVELIAHEFEHLIEQLDGVNLRALARTNKARQLSDGAFETDRAIAAGHQVAGEVLDNTPDHVRQVGATVWRALRRE
jgi:hypothetical protein